MEYWYFLMYKRIASCVGRANIKNGAGSVKNPRRRDIAPTGELAGLPARDAPKTSEVLTSLDCGRGLCNPRENLGFAAHAHRNFLI
jgi:hypothetical protein